MSLANKLAPSFLALCLATILPSCDSGITAPGLEAGGGERVPSVRIEKTELQLLAGDTARVVAQVVGWSGAVLAGQSVTWSSSAPEVAGVSPGGTVTALRPGEAVLTARAGQASATARVRVGARVLHLVVTPQEDTLNTVGVTVQLSAAVLDAHGAPLPGVPVAWQSLDAAVADVDSEGRVTSLDSGVARITASAGGQTDTVRLHVKGNSGAFRLRPREATLYAIGDTVRLQADAQDTKGNVVAPTLVKWTSLDPGVATVDEAGLVTGRAGGTALVRGEYAGRVDTVRIEVRQLLASIAVTPAAPTLQAGQSQQMVAVAKDANGYDIPGVAFGWASSNTPVATVDGAGLVRAVAAGVSYVTASSGTRSATATVTVSADPGTVPSRLVVTPEAVTLDALGAAAQLGAAVYSVSGSAMSGAGVSWSSLDAGVATVDGSGRVVARTVGTARVVATSGALADTAVVQVRQVVASVAVSPSEPALQPGQTQQVSATAKDAGGYDVPGAAFAWTSSNPAAATVDGAGLVRAVAAGVSYVTASAGGKSAVATVTVSAPPPVEAPVATVSVTPASVSVVVGGGALLTATARDAAGNVLTGRVVTWSTSSPAVATVSSLGMLTGVAMGSATITATVEGKTGTSAVTVTADPALVVGRVVVTPGSDTLNALGAAAQLAATVYSAAGSTMSGAGVSWSSLDASTATVDASGRVTAKAAGTARIVAASGGAADTARVVVRQVVASVAVSPASPVLLAGGTQQMTAVAKDANGYVVPGAAFGWASSNPAAATVDGSGLAKAVAEGVSYITASSGGKSAVATLTVSAPVVASVVVSPGTASLAVGETVSLTAVVKDASGRVLSGRTVTWKSSNAAVATVSGTGAVTGVVPGTATITATSEGKSGSASVTVVAPVSGPALAFLDGFESGVLAAPTAAGYRWRLPSADASSKVSISTDIARSGGNSLKFMYGGNADPCDDAWAEQRFEMGENLQEVWFEYYVYLPRGGEAGNPKFYHRSPTCASKNDPNGVNSNNKFFALWDLDYNAKDVKVLFEYRRTDTGADGDSKLYGMFCSDTRSCGAWNWAGGRWDPAFTDAMRGRWAQIRIHAKVADSKTAANGMLQMWVDGALRINMQGLDLAPEAGGNRFFRNGYLMGWSNSGFNQNTAVYIDDFKIYRSSPGW